MSVTCNRCRQPVDVGALPRGAVAFHTSCNQAAHDNAPLYPWPPQIAKDGRKVADLQWRYRVVGILHDGSERFLGDGFTLDYARLRRDQSVRRDPSRYRRVIIEKDDGNA